MPSSIESVPQKEENAGEKPVCTICLKDHKTEEHGKNVINDIVSGKYYKDQPGPEKK
jgi:hypothetical protein